MEAIKAVIRAIGKNPEQILTREALADGATAHFNGDDLANYSFRS